jgi:hypothetical protein
MIIVAMAKDQSVDPGALWCGAVQLVRGSCPVDPVSGELSAHADRQILDRHESVCSRASV